MISGIEMREILGRMERLWGDLDELQYKEYFNQLKSHDAGIMSKAVDLTVKTHRTTRFPTIGEIYQNYQEIVSQLPKTRDPDQNCMICQDVGVVIDDRDGLARPCTCMEGQSVRRGWEAHDREHKYYRAPRRRERRVARCVKS